MSIQKTLIVYAKSARYLYNTEIFGKQDPYLIAHTNRDPTNKQTTRVHKDSGTHATWNSTFQFTFVDDGTPLNLYFEVWNQNTLVCYFPLNHSLPPSTRLTNTHFL